MKFGLLLSGVLLATMLPHLGLAWDETGGVSAPDGQRGRPANLPDILGEWFVADQSEALVDNENPRSLTITKVVAAPTPYNDGYFLCRWSGQSTLTKGFYTLKNQRLVLNTTRTVEGKRLSVQYSGRLAAQGGKQQWVGTAGAVGLTELRDGSVRDWSFTATRQKKGSA